VRNIVWSLGLVMCLAVAPCAHAAGLVAEYRCESVEGGVLVDETKSWPGKVVGKVAAAPGRDGRALAMSGEGYVQAAVPESFAFAQGFTLEAWIRPERLAAGRIVDRSTPASSDSFCLDTHPGDAIRLITPAGTISAPSVLKVGRWMHVAGLYDADEGLLAIYIDGKPAVQQPAASRVPVGGKNPLTLGADPAGGNRLHGRIDEVRIYDFALLDEDVAARFEGKPVSPPASIGGAPRPICYRNGLQVNREALLGRNDVVYLSPAVHEHEALPVGNGRLCAMVWNGDGLNLQLNHADNVWHQASSGRVHLRVQPSLADQAAGFESRLSLYDGTLHAKGPCGAGQWRAAVTVLEAVDVVAVRFEGKLPSPEIRVDLEQWRPGIRVIRGSDSAGFVEELPGPPQTDRFDRKMALVVRADCPAAPAPSNEPGGCQVVSLILAPKPDDQGSVAFTLWIANPITPREGDPQKEATRLLAQALKQGWHAASTQAAARWSRFWDRSFLHLASPDGAADYMENLWYLHLYWMGCAGQGEYPIKFNGGPFLVYRDLRGWGTSYWYQNTREPYWPLPAANHLELCEPLRHLYVSTLPAHRRLARELFRKVGAQVEETMRIDGQGDKRGNPYTMLYLSTGLECALELHRHAVFACDDEALREEVYPLLKETVEFYLDYATRGPDGTYHIAPENGRETYRRVQDSMTSIAALRVALPILLRESERLGLDAAMRPRWEEFLAHLAPLPENAEAGIFAPCVFPAELPPAEDSTIQRLYAPGQSVSRSIKEKFNSENVEIDVVYPFGLAGIGSEDYQKAVRTYEQRQFRHSSGWDWAAVCAARLGLADEAARVQAEHCRHSQVWPQGFWYSPAGTYWAGGMSDAPYFDPPGVNATATTEMVLQSHGGRIRVWPAAPKSWSGAFQLRAETGFLVASERSAGTVQYVEIESLFGDVCRLVNPWAEAVRVSCAQRPILESSDAELVLPTEKGKHYLVERVALPVGKLAFERLSPAKNDDVKYMASAGRRQKALSPRPGLPMLGITRDGLTVPRLRAAQNRESAARAIGEDLGDRTKLDAVRAVWLDGAGQSQPAPWLIDGRYGPENIAVRSGQSFVLELKEPAVVGAVVWSYDRNGQRYDFARARKIVVESSADGQTWTSPVENEIQGHFGQAVLLPEPRQARFVRIAFVDPDGKRVAATCDEIDVYRP